MISDPTLNLTIARSRIALMQAEAASDRLARSGRAPGTSWLAGAVAPLRRLAGAVTFVVARRHPAGKAA